MHGRNLEKRGMGYLTAVVPKTQVPRHDLKCSNIMWIQYADQNKSSCAILEKFICARIPYTLLTLQHVRVMLASWEFSVVTFFCSFWYEYFCDHVVFICLLFLGTGTLKLRRNIYLLLSCIKKTDMALRGSQMPPPYLYLHPRLYSAGQTPPRKRWTCVMSSCWAHSSALMEAI